VKSDRQHTSNSPTHTCGDIGFQTQPLNYYGNVLISFCCSLLLGITFAHEFLENGWAEFSDLWATQVSEQLSHRINHYSFQYNFSRKCKSCIPLKNKTLLYWMMATI